MKVKILEKGSTKVYAPDDQVADYLFLGFTDTGTTTEVVVTDPSKEIVEMKIEDDVVTAFRYKGDPVWRTVAGSGGTDTYKVKIDGTDTADFLENKLQQGTNVTITKSGGKLVVNSTGGSGSSSLLDPVADVTTLKAIDTTTFTTVKEIQVATLGKYKFQPASTLVGDDSLIITPTVGTGRWIKQSIDVPKYNFKAIDFGVALSLMFENKKGGLNVRGNGSYGGYKTGVTCQELIGKGKIIKFKIVEGGSYPVMLLCANGSYTNKLTDYRAFSLQFIGASFSLSKEVGSVSTSIAGTSYNSVIMKSYPLDIVIKHFGKRMSVNAFESLTGVMVASYVYEDDDLGLFGNTYAFSNQSVNFSYYTNIEIGNITSYGKNIVWEGDSQTKDGGMENSGIEIPSIFMKKYLNKNVDVHQQAVVGKKLDAGVTNLVNTMAKKSLVSENIFYINLGINDISAANPTLMLSQLDTLISTAKSNGFKVLVCTICNGINLESANATLLTYNTGIRSRYASNAFDYLVDIQDIANGFIDQATGAVYRDYIIQDGLHFSAKMKEKVADKVAEKIGLLNIENILTGIDSGDGEVVALNIPLMKKIVDIDQIYTATEKTKLSAINAVGTVVTSATTVTVPANKTIFHVTGTTAISTINLPYTGFTGKISIIPDGIFTFDTAGNIAETYTATVSRVIDLVYDGTKWYRVNS